MRQYISRTVLAAAALVLASCSTTRLVPEGKYRYESSKIEIEGAGYALSSSDIDAYLRQQPNRRGILSTPFLWIYNWSDGSGRGINGIWEKLGTEPVVFDPLLAEASCDNVASHLRHLGYYGSTVTPEISYKGRNARVTYHIRPGKRYRIDEIVYDVPEGEFGDDFADDMPYISIREGDYISEAALEEESVRGAAIFRGLGYYDFSRNHYFFEADTLDPARNILYYRVKGITRAEGDAPDRPIERYRIGDVSIYHPEDIRFREDILRDFNTIRPGDIYSERVVNATYNRLSNLKTFNTVNIELKPVEGKPVVDCDIRLNGSSLKGFKADLEVSSNSSGLIGISPQFNIFHKNIFHGGERLNLGLSGNWQFRPGTDIRSTEFGVSSSISIPRMLGLVRMPEGSATIPHTEISVSYNYQNRPEYRRSIAGFTYSYVWQPADSKYYFQLSPMRLSLAKLYNYSDEFLGTLVANPYLMDTFFDNVDLGIGGMVYWTTNADIVPKVSYNYQRLVFDVSGNFLSLFNGVLPRNEWGEYLFMNLPYNQYVKLDLQLGWTRRFGSGDRRAVATRFEIGAARAYGNSSGIPFEKQFYCGGASSMRGWQARTLGPGFESMDEVFVIPSQVGDLKIEADLEYRFPIISVLEGALFAEAGNIWLLNNSRNLLSGLAGDWGFGLRVNLDFILLRLDLGFKTHDPSRAEGMRWLGPAEWFRRDGFSFHFGVGYPF